MSKELKNEERKKNKKNPKNNRATSKREAIHDWNSVTRWTLLRATLYPIVFHIIHWRHHLQYYSLYLEGKRVLLQPSLCPSFIVGKACWSHLVNMHKYCGSSASCFLLTLKLHTPNKDKLSYGDDKVSHYCFHYRIQVPDRNVCDRSWLNILSNTINPSMCIYIYISNVSVCVKELISSFFLSIQC